MTANHCRASRSNDESRHFLMTASLIVLRALLTVVGHGTMLRCGISIRPMSQMGQ
jgi:hypothetical protein